MTTATGQDVRTIAAEYAILDRYDTIRSHAGHDYGGSRRGRALYKLRDELGYGPEIQDVFDTLTPAELRAAFQRVGRPKLRRAQREAATYYPCGVVSQGTARTIATWEQIKGDLAGLVT